MKKEIGHIAAETASHDKRNNSPENVKRLKAEEEKKEATKGDEGKERTAEKWRRMTPQASPLHNKIHRHQASQR